MLEDEVVERAEQDQGDDPSDGDPGQVYVVEDVGLVQPEGGGVQGGGTGVSRWVWKGNQAFHLHVLTILG